jgi:hypothetical protein
MDRSSAGDMPVAHSVISSPLSVRRWNSEEQVIIKQSAYTVNITEFFHSKTINKWQNRLTIFLLFIPGKSLLKF